MWLDSGSAAVEGLAAAKDGYIRSRGDRTAAEAGVRGLGLIRFLRRVVFEGSHGAHRVFFVKMSKDMDASKRGIVPTYPEPRMHPLPVCIVVTMEAISSLRAVGTRYVACI